MIYSHLQHVPFYTLKAILFTVHIVNRFLKQCFCTLFKCQETGNSSKRDRRGVIKFVIILVNTHLLLFPDLLLQFKENIIKDPGAMVPHLTFFNDKFSRLFSHKLRLGILQLFSHTGQVLKMMFLLLASVLYVASGGQ